LTSGVIVPRGFAYHIWAAWLAGRFTLVISEGMILELAGKLAEPRIATRYGVTPQEIHILRIDGNMTATRELHARYSPAVLGKTQMHSDLDEAFDIA
jgi:hypothetical protein